MQFKWYKIICVLFSISVLFMGCSASIPEESVTLNQEIGINIKKLHESNLRFIELYFRNQSKKIDKAVEGAVDNFFKSIATQINENDVENINDEALEGIKSKILQYYNDGNKYKDTLQIIKALVIESLNSNYLVTVNANTTITGLLQSYVNLDRATQSGLKTIEDYTNINITSLQNILDDYVIKAGSFSGKSTDIYKKVKELIDTE